MLWVSRRASRTDRTRAAAIMFGGWLLLAGLVLSFMSGTTHSYYSVALAPPIGALVGIGSHGFWRIRHTWFARATMAVAIAATAAWAWALLGRSPSFFPWLRVAIVIAAVGAVGMILAGPSLRAAGAPDPAAAGRCPGIAGCGRHAGRPAGLQPGHRIQLLRWRQPVRGPHAGRGGRRPGCARLRRRVPRRQRQRAVRSAAARPAAASSAVSRAGSPAEGRRAAGASAASGATLPSAPPWLSCSRRAPPGTRGPRPPRPPTPRPR